MVFQLHKKDPQIIFFSLKIFFRGKKNCYVLRFSANKMAAELNCARRTRKIVEENAEQILRKENKKKKKGNGVRTPLVPKEDKKGLNDHLPSSHR